jgi:hypothetical protein
VGFPLLLYRQVNGFRKNKHLSIYKELVYP